VDKINRCTDELFSIVLSCPIGTVPVIKEKEKTIVDWIQQEEWLQSQLNFYNSLASITFKSGDSDDIAELQKEITACQEQVYQMTAQNSHNKLLVRRVIEQPLLSNIVFSEEELTPKEELLKNSICHRDQKMKEFNMLDKESRTLRKEAYKYEEDIAESKVSVRKAIRSVKNANSNSERKDCAEVDKKLQQELKKLDDENEILRNVFLNLIVESNLAFSNDKELQAQVEELIKPPYTMD